MKVQVWYRVICECGKINFVHADDLLYDNDLSKLDVDGYKCWSCHKESSFFEEMDPEDMMCIEYGKPVTVFWTTHDGEGDG